MKTTILSLLMAALLATSGFAFAQPNPAKAGTDGGSGPTAAEKAAPGAMPATRAEVKSGISAEATKSGTDGGSGPTTADKAKAATGTMPATRAEVKSGINVDATKSGTDGGSGATPGAATKAGAMASTSAERKAKRDERKAKRNMKKDDMTAAGQMKPKAP